MKTHIGYLQGILRNTSGKYYVKMLVLYGSKPSITKFNGIAIASKRRNFSDEIQDDYSNTTKANLKVACRSKLLPVTAGS